MKPEELGPSLLDDITLLFTNPPPGERFLTAQTGDKLGGRLETRSLRALAKLAASLQVVGWSHVGLVLEVAAQVRWLSHPARSDRHKVRYFVTSLPADTPPAAALRAVYRHWHIENRLRWPRDVTLGEDACQVRSGHAPPRCWRPYATPSWICCLATGRPIALPPCAPTPGSHPLFSSACSVLSHHKRRMTVSRVAAPVRGTSNGATSVAASVRLACTPATPGRFRMYVLRAMLRRCSSLSGK